MNSWLNAAEDTDALDAGWSPSEGRMIRTTAQMLDPGPSQTFVFTDERADSINDGYFAVSMHFQGRTARLGDWPGCYHNGSGSFSFADGRAELHKWVDRRTTPPLQKTWEDLGSKYSLASPVRSRAKSKAQGIQCLNNLKQFALAWSMYNGDNEDRIPPNNPFDGVPAPVTNTWVRGWLDLGADSSDATNTVYLTQSLLAPGLGRSIPIWHCPSDKSTSRQGSRTLPRVRTVSMNCWLNSDRAWDTYDNFPVSGRIFKEASDMTDPGPSQTFVFTDERADSINDGYFALSMFARGRTAQFDDCPGSYHNGAGTFSFADVHAEPHRWVDPRTKPPLQKNRGFADSIPVRSPDNHDVDWLQTHATGLISR